MAYNSQSGSGDGFRFERDVEGILSALMLADSGLDLFPNERIISIRPQCRSADLVWTDDFWLKLHGGGKATIHKVFLQCKSTVCLTPGDPGFSSAVVGVYRDFFRENKSDYEDYILVTGPLSRQDFARIDDALISIHERNEEQFFKELRSSTDQKHAREFFEICKLAVENSDCGLAVEDIKLFSCLKHFHVIRPDLRMRGSLDGSLAAALLQKMGYRFADRILDLLRGFFEKKNRAGAEFTKENLEEHLQDYRMVVSPQDASHIITEAVVSEKRKLHTGVDPKVWCGGIEAQIFSGEDVCEEPLARDAAIALAVKTHELGKLSYAEKKVWSGPVLELCEKVANANLDVWNRIQDGLSYLIEASPAYYKVRLGDDASVMGQLITTNSLQLCWITVLRGLSQLLWGDGWWLQVFEIVLAAARMENSIGVYRDSHRFLEYFLSGDYANGSFESEARVAYMKHILNTEPKIGWSILRNLLPTISIVRHSYSFPSVFGEYDDVVDGVAIAKTRNPLSDVERDKLFSGYIELAIETARTDRERFKDFMQMVDVASAKMFKGIVRLLEEKLRTAVSAEEKEGLFQMTMAAWTASIECPFYPDEKMQRVVSLMKIAEAVRPSECFGVCKFALDVDSLRCDAEIKDWQAKWLRQLYQEAGFSAILDCARIVKDSHGVGEILYRAIGNIAAKDILPSVLQKFDSELQPCIRTYFSWCLRHSEKLGGPVIDDWNWVLSLGLEKWRADERGTLFACFPFCHDVWARAQAMLGKDVVEYWGRLHVAIPADKDFRGVQEVVKGLMGVGRVLDAVLLCKFSSDIGGEISAQLVLDALAALTENMPTREQCHSFIHYIEWALRRAQDAVELPQATLAEIEWRLYDVVLAPREFRALYPIATYRELACNPDFFVHYVEGRVQAGMDDRIKREHKSRAASILRGWYICPGTIADRFDDELFEKWNARVLELTNGSTELYEKSCRYIAQGLNYLPRSSGSIFRYTKLWGFINSEKGSVLRECYKMMLCTGPDVVTRIRELQGDLESRRNRYIRYSQEALKAGYSHVALAFEAASTMCA